MAFASFYLILLLSLLTLHASAEVKNHHPSCPPFNCGKLGRISFPFTNTTHSDCGFIAVDGCSEPVQRIQLEGGGKWYEAKSISENNTVQIHDEELQTLLKSNQCYAFSNLTLPSSPFLSFQVTPNLTVFKCCHTLNNTPSSDSNYTGCKDYNIFYNYLGHRLPSLPLLCSILQLPFSKPEKRNNIFELLTANYSLEIQVSSACYNCFKQGGQCELESKKFQCTAKVGHNGLLVVRATTVTAAVGILALSVLLCCIRRKYSLDKSIFTQKKGTQNHQSIEAILKNNGPLAPKRYSYSDVRNMTKSFREKLGQGGYGSVFKGNLPDGSLVAVKVLHESKSNEEEFINEVSIISRTSHVNIVTLLGFCFDGPKRALIYELMPNGSLEKFIHKENVLKADYQLGWQKLFQIAVGIARGLEYLHRGCKTRILHLDIKPHNILLDDEFCPKISDFGMAKTCPSKDSIISTLSTRGTAGYIAPEVFCRNYGGVSHKSDVYSYGMLVLEMAAGKNIIDDDVGASPEHISETYFPHLIYNKLEQDKELGLQGMMNQEDKENARKIVIVGLWCIQTDPSNRPPMSRVVEMLEGNLESLLIPPKPFLSSPPRSQSSSSSTIDSSIF
ncbi:hypothetical protein P3X46_031377 [Hevea brasiliensis]|uniref:Protein kinase domain-containing protein n=1 Tax=Hevea brasiliensis TaxID=3981 RepID=A0ABQ9KLA2_HEVBR|nr:LEAF RUST 10 DISEASE-RESISTANCE LOCUS RECEPTOR-LIKE PROTEIN KINASE-like 2.1 [Hevea brasiliensis]KAJ9140772.1 hypothetical protein P3X46_031377 [Hevea brasiliensis]